MQYPTITFCITTICLFITSCDKEIDDQSCIYDEAVIISKSGYNTAPNDDLNIISTELIGNCLNIKFGAGGCSGSSWEIKLIDSGIILYSDPPQRNLRLSLKNQETCRAYIIKEIAFDIKNLQVKDNQILLNIKNYEDQILYEY